MYIKYGFNVHGTWNLMCKSALNYIKFNVISDSVWI